MLLLLTLVPVRLQIVPVKTADNKDDDVYNNQFNNDDDCIICEKDPVCVCVCSQDAERKQLFDYACLQRSLTMQA